MTVQSIPELPFCAPAFRRIVSSPMTRRTSSHWAAASFAKWIASRWSPHREEPFSRAGITFRKERRSRRLSIGFGFFMRQPPGLFHKSLLQVAFFRNLSPLLSRPDLYSSHPKLPETRIGLHSLSFGLVEKTFRYHSGLLRILETTFGRDGRPPVTRPMTLLALNMSFKDQDGDRTRRPEGLSANQASLAPGIHSRRLGWTTPPNRPFICAKAAHITVQPSWALRALIHQRLIVAVSSQKEFRSRFGHYSNDGSSARPIRLSLATTIRRESREDELGRSLQAKPASMVYIRSESSGVKAISSLLQDVKKSISEIHLPTAAAPTEIDVRQLTRNVYDQLERELRIERERRGR